MVYPDISLLFSSKSCVVFLAAAVKLLEIDFELIFMYGITLDSSTVSWRPVCSLLEIFLVLLFKVIHAAEVSFVRLSLPSVCLDARITVLELDDSSHFITQD